MLCLSSTKQAAVLTLGRTERDLLGHLFWTKISIWAKIVIFSVQNFVGTNILFGTKFFHELWLTVFSVPSPSCIYFPPMLPINNYSQGLEGSMNESGQKQFSGTSYTLICTSNLWVPNCCHSTWVNWSLAKKWNIQSLINCVLRIA